MAIIGNGAQSEFQALAFQHMLNIESVRLFDVDPRATAKLLVNLADSGLELVVCDSVAEAVAGADIVTTITADKRSATTVTEEMLEPGMHINAVGGDCPGKTELAAAVLSRAKVFVEFEPQSRVEGDIQQMPAEFPVTELHEVFKGTAAGREHRDDITVFDSVGFALEDFSALHYMAAAAQELGIGRQLDLIARSEDPRDLFGCFTSLATLSV